MTAQAASSSTAAPPSCATAPPRTGTASGTSTRSDDLLGARHSSGASSHALMNRDAPLEWRAPREEHRVLRRREGLMSSYRQGRFVVSTGAPLEYLGVNSA